jgi:superoxide dismutase, Fe-Mn family
MTYTPKTFSLPALDGLSQKQIDVHLTLYQGYVKHVNLIVETIARLKEEGAEKNQYAINELRRRLGFEFCGMRMHERYFEQFEGGLAALSPESPLARAAAEKYGSVDAFIAHIKEVAGTRGIGWVVVYMDDEGKTLHTAFVNDHELGQLSGLPVILAVDLWEHAYMVDFLPADKMRYIDAFLANLNWPVADTRMPK